MLEGTSSELSDVNRTIVCQAFDTAYPALSPGGESDTRVQYFFDMAEVLEDDEVVQDLIVTAGALLGHPDVDLESGTEAMASATAGCAAAYAGLSSGSTGGALGDLDCADMRGPQVVGGGDPYALDADGDGIGCE